MFYAKTVRKPYLRLSVIVDAIMGHFLQLSMEDGGVDANGGFSNRNAWTEIPCMSR
ncbi:hypothetical protein Pcar_3371 [Syntrophotalea carbinolica DSM 2380]|uniref:Uncharacterized protein n=1 Tax=Syntrophotalea carbinolica (strain DSM 2380 / NBRC 103641 / GraBd1) TaxID=338963 RepID=Q0C6F2_SYNC1|nr:hypothetical protein Pcar_3371 [Syntrophotalea carbinolica DSM 2380]